MEYSRSGEDVSVNTVYSLRNQGATERSNGPHSNKLEQLEYKLEKNIGI